MAFSMAGGGPSGPQINVTPLIDVLLTLIIMFMLVVSMDPEFGEEAQIPQPPKDPKSQSAVERTVVIEVIWTTKDQPPIGKDQPRGRALEQSRDSSVPDLLDARRKGSVCSRRRRRGFSVRRRRHRCSPSCRGKAAGTSNAGSNASGLRALQLRNSRSPHQSVEPRTHSSGALNR